jgi:NAD(P)-dependent dehydrogenase (short-subunit alcohol dehydrogenase family)
MGSTTSTRPHYWENIPNGGFSVLDSEGKSRRITHKSHHRDEACLDFGLNGRTALVVGADLPVGKVCVRLLADEGMTVVPVEARIYADGAVAVLSDVEAIDVIVSILPPTPEGFLSDIADEILIASWGAIAAFAAICQAFLPGMRERGWGRVICVGPAEAKGLTDRAADLNRIVGLGTLGLQKNLAGEMGKFGITAASVLLDASLKPTERAIEAAAATAVFLASEGASYLTGVVITVDGNHGRGTF